jgi:hypothetical protein
MGRLLARGAAAGALFVAGVSILCAALLAEDRSDFAAWLSKRPAAPRTRAATARPVEPAPVPSAPLSSSQMSALSPAQAVAFNLSIPTSPAPNPPAIPVQLAFETADDRVRAIDCLASAVYYC